MTLRILRENFRLSPAVPPLRIARLIALLKRVLKLCHTK